MKTEDFEKRVQRQTLKQVPAEWREDILSAARQASSPQHATRNAQDASRWRSVLSTFNSQLSALLWPHPVAWAGLAAVWVVIMGINVRTQDATTVIAKRASPTSPQIFMAFQEQERLLSELIGPRDTPVAEQPKPRLPRPRSEGRRALVMA
jgi:hypothetical protein